ncbi:ketopantoate reductase family protein [Burkholderia vietnamiensis]|jgi:2-dehydropantoate 2-reductase|uniref:ketopantoate reductase family protein n=1 Tax=Burkholderia vietnamiensis TaxID=60552 RepID=UPI0007554401|nr:2-dehydropantoate 2-reductase [Burkholderia vietnamiensis]KVF01638.1 2-dehydropantoate 2-reductase [Burkholderia vietnamiensis]MBR7972063.1 2-dehydropantoate 2-reductase [Burkholderia vietnamiensis]
MQIAILGAGAMGSFFGGRLALAGHAVSLLDIDDAHLASIRDHGLRLSTDSGEQIVRNLVALRPEAASEPVDLVIVFTKTMHTTAALAAASAVLGPDTVILSLQNGLGNAERLASSVSPERVMVGVTTWPADKSAPGAVSSHGQGTIRLMTANGTHTRALEQTVQALNDAGLSCHVDRDVWAAIWEKVAFNAALNSLCAVTQCTVGELTNIPDGEELALKIVAEVTAVARALGISANEAHVAANVRDALAHHRAHRPSMLQDVLASRRTEIEAINGAVVDAARKVGVAAPYTDSLACLVRLVDARTRQPGAAAARH